MNSSSSLQSSPRRGLSLIEVFVAIVILGLLMALLLPAVQSSRETARRIQCASQLRQIVLASENYHAAYDRFPRRAWQHQLLPFLEQPTTIRRFAGYACPSDRQHADGDLLQGKTSYAMNMGWGEIFENGLILDSSRQILSHRDVRDGSSQTAMFAERLSFPWFATQVVDWNEHRSLWNRVFLRVTYPAATLDEFHDLCRDRPGPPLTSYFLTEEYTHVMTPNSNNCLEYPSSENPTPRNWQAVTAGSPHPGGTQVAFVDGSIKFVGNDVDLNVWRALGTRNGQEVLSGEAF